MASEVSVWVALRYEFHRAASIRMGCGGWGWGRCVCLVDAWRDKDTYGTTCVVDSTQLMPRGSGQVSAVELQYMQAHTTQAPGWNARLPFGGGMY